MRFGVVVSRFNEHHLDPAARRCRRGATSATGSAPATLTVVWVPGAFEIPIAARELAQHGGVDAVVCLGAVIRGDTPHFDYVAGEAARGIASVHATTGVPATFGVLTVDTIEQATDRAGGKHGNKGADAAIAAVEMVSLLRDLRRRAHGRASRCFMSASTRVVSLLPSATEILFAIGAGDRVVGVTHECDHPVGARGLPTVTASELCTEGAAPGAIDRHIHAARHAGSSIYRLDEAELARLQPDLIITQELCDVCTVAYSEVRRAVRRLPGDVPVLSLEPRSVEEICASVEEVGSAIGLDENARLTAAAMRDRIDRDRQPRPAGAAAARCRVSSGPTQLMVGGHWVPEMVRLAGGVDVLGVRARRLATFRGTKWSNPNRRS